MKALRAMQGDPRKGQRGSILGAMLIMVALLAILIGGLMGELSSSFVLSKNLVKRTQLEATVNSAVELGLYQLKNTSVPPVCARDARGPWYLTSLNGSPAQVTPTCTGIVPDQSASLAAGSYSVDGVHQVANTHDSYVVGDQAGGLRSYRIGSTAPEWSIALGGPITAPVYTHPDEGNYPFVDMLVPNSAGGACGGHCVSMYDEPASGSPHLACVMASAGTVTGQPAAEDASGSTNFPDYFFFGDTSGNLYVYDGSCQLQAQAAGPGGAIAGQPLVYTGSVLTHSHTTTVIDDIITVATSGAATRLVHWQYAEATDNSEGGTTKTLSVASSVIVAVGGNAVVSAPSTATPSAGATIQMAIAGQSGQVAIGRVTVGSSGHTFTISTSTAASLGAGLSVVSAPGWCHCPGGDIIGVGATNGFLYLLDTTLNVTNQYDGQADGRPAIRSTPTADANGDWYFGADDGYVYDVEIPSSGSQMFKAARFGPGGAVRSSPVQAACSTGPCIYFGSTTSGYFVRLGSTRIIDLRACATSTPGSTNCAANPRLWARAEVGLPSVVGGQGILVQGWSYYSP